MAREGAGIFGDVSDLFGKIVRRPLFRANGSLFSCSMPFGG
jgi:hypothetical protein